MDVPWLPKPLHLESCSLGLSLVWPEWRLSLQGGSRLESLSPGLPVLGTWSPQRREDFPTEAGLAPPISGQSVAPSAVPTLQGGGAPGRGPGLQASSRALASVRGADKLQCRPLEQRVSGQIEVTGTSNLLRKQGAQATGQEEWPQGKYQSAFLAVNWGHQLFVGLRSQVSPRLVTD